jgi:hypothetical protein
MTSKESPSIQAGPVLEPSLAGLPLICPVVVLCRSKQAQAQSFSSLGGTGRKYGALFLYCTYYRRNPLFGYIYFIFQAALRMLLGSKPSQSKPHREISNRASRRMQIKDTTPCLLP